MRNNIHTMISIGVLLFMILMVAAAVYDMRRGGSLDDLTPDEIKAAVNGK